MIVYYLGIPGSGKTYSAVNTIYNNFSNDKEAKKDLKKDYINCYTNINEFKFDKLENVISLDLDSFYENLELLYEMYKSKCTDDELIQSAKELNIYKTLFVLDECHNFFDTVDKVKVWWLTYHRHLYHDVILITQNLALVNSKYKPLAEAFYKAKPSSLILRNKYFHYTYFTDSRMSQAGKVNVLKIKKNQKVFELYKSGDSVKSKNVILYFLTFSSIFVILALIFGYFYFDKSVEDTNKSSNAVKSSSVGRSLVDNVKNDVSTTSYTESSNTPDSPDNDFSNKVLSKFNCSYSVCSSGDIAIPPQLLKKFIDMKLAHVYYSSRVNKNLTVFYISVTNDFYDFLNFKKGTTNENYSTVKPINLFGSK